jgi:DNA repair exonuclease SbcCD ATPase subunit
MPVPPPTALTNNTPRKFAMLSFPSAPAAPLTYEAWDKGKAALTPETGVGKALKKVAEAWKKMSPAAFIDMNSASGPDEFETAKQSMTKAMPDLIATNKALDELQKLASAKAKEGEKSRTFPDKSVKLLKSIAEEAGKLSDLLREYPGEAENNARKTLDGFEQRVQHKIQLVERSLEAVKQNDKTSKEIEKSLTESLKAAVVQAKTDRNAAKEKVMLALKQVATMEQLVKSCETETSEWRTDKSTVDKKTKDLLADKGIEIMKIRKEVDARAKKAKESVIKVHGIIGKAN